MKTVDALFEAFNNLQVLVIGDVMIDRYIHGKVNRISPEAPVPVVLHQSTNDRLGGAANVALNIQAMGATAHLCSVIGADQNASFFLQMLDNNNLIDQGILQAKDRTTTIKTRVLASNQHLLRIDTEDTHAISISLEDQLIEKVKNILDHQSIDVILFQDYNKGVLTPKVISTIIDEAKNRQIKTAVDPKKELFYSYQNCDLFKPNLKEIQEAIPFPVHANLDSLKKAAAFLHQKLQHQYTLITLSEKGIYIDNHEEGAVIPTQKRNITDVCGAGDTVISIAALALAISLRWEDIAVLSNLAGGQVCEKVGVVPIDKLQLKKEYIKLLMTSKTEL